MTRQSERLNNKAFLIFSGFNMRAIVAFCRQMEEIGLAFFIVAYTTADPILRTRYRKKVVAVRTSSGLTKHDIGHCIQQARDRTGTTQFVICPTSEYLNIFLLKNADFFKEQNCELPLVNLALYSRVSNKHSSSQLFREYGISVPLEFPDYGDLDFPFVAKPHFNINPKGRSLYPYLIYNEDELDRFKALEDQTEFYYQEFIDGSSYYLLFYFARNGQVHRYSQKNILQQANGKSIVYAESATCHEGPIAEQFSSVLTEIGFYGLAMIELMQRDGEYIFIEINPRFWGPLQLTVDARSGILPAFINDWLFRHDEISLHRYASPRKKVHYLWLGGLLSTTLSSEVLKCHGQVLRYPVLSILQRLHSDVYLRPDTIRVFLHEILVALDIMRKKRRNMPNERL